MSCVADTNPLGERPQTKHEVNQISKILLSQNDLFQLGKALAGGIQLNHGGSV